MQQDNNDDFFGRLPRHLPTKRLSNRQAEWMGTELIADVEIFEVNWSETQFGKKQLKLSETETEDDQSGWEEVWVLQRTQKKDDPFRH